MSWNQQRNYCKHKHLIQRINKHSKHIHVTDAKRGLTHTWPSRDSFSLRIWLPGWVGLLFKPITERSEAVLKQSCITVDTQLKIPLGYLPDPRLIITWNVSASCRNIAEFRLSLTFSGNSHLPVVLVHPRIQVGIVEIRFTKKKTNK